jgi:hypothetical protein
LEEENSSNTSTDDAQTVILDKKQQEDDLRDSRDVTPFSASEDMLSHLGEAPEIEWYKSVGTSSISASMSHRNILSRTRSNEIEFPHIVGSLTGVVASTPSSQVDTEGMLPRQFLGQLA